MNELRSILKETVERLFADLKADRNGDPRTDWQELEKMGLPTLLQSQATGGFGGDWEDAGAIFRASGAYRLTIPVSETIVARSWLTDLSQTSPKGIGSFLLHSTAGAGPIEFERILRTGIADWVLVIGESSWQLFNLQVTDSARITTKADLMAGDLRNPVIAQGSLDGERQRYILQAALMRACQMAGVIEAMVSLTIDYARDRQQFGRSLASFQAIQHQLALAVEESAAASCAAASACQAMSHGDAEFEIAAAKWRVGSAADRVFDIAHQVHGAIGFTHEYGLHELSLRLQEWRRDFGNEAYWARDIAKTILSDRSRPLWHFLTARHDATLLAERTKNAS